MLHLYRSTDVELREAQCHRKPLGATLPEKIDWEFGTVCY